MGLNVYPECSCVVLTEAAQNYNSIFQTSRPRSRPPPSCPLSRPLPRLVQRHWYPARFQASPMVDRLNMRQGITGRGGTEKNDMLGG